MKTFEIQYIARLREQKDYCSEMIDARNEISALKKFAKIFRIKDYKQLLNSNFSWEDDSDWLYWFKCINEVVSCPSHSVRNDSLGRKGNHIS